MRKRTALIHILISILPALIGLLILTLNENIFWEFIFFFAGSIIHIVLTFDLPESLLIGISAISRCCIIYLFIICGVKYFKYSKILYVINIVVSLFILLHGAYLLNALSLV